MNIFSVAAATVVALAAMPAMAEPYKTSFGPTTTEIGPGHAAHTSVPKANFWPGENLDVELFGIPGANAALQLLTTGKLDFVNLDIEALMVGQAKGVKIQGYYVHTAARSRRSWS